MELKMKKILLAVILLSFLLIGCQESSSIVAPDNSDINLDKRSNPTEFVPTDTDTSEVRYGNRPGLVRV
jgi:uncharacterized protein YcfL